MQRLQPFGYADPERSLYHDTEQVVREVSVQFGMIPPVEQGNRTQQQFASDVARLFWSVYRTKYRSFSFCARRRVVRDALEYSTTGVLPYYVMRVWFGKKNSERFAVRNFQQGLVPLSPR